MTRWTASSICSRTYGSFAAYYNQASVLGKGWSFTLGSWLQLVKQGNIVFGATVFNGNGSRTQFRPTEQGTWVAPASVDATLVQQSNGTYLYTVGKREFFTFSSAGKLQTISDLNGNSITLKYEGTRLTSASDNFGRSLAFHYSGVGQLSEVTDSSGRAVKYAYNASGLLETVTDVRGGHTVYGYNSKGWLTTRTDATGHLVMTNTYNAGAQVVTQAGARPEDTTTYTYGANYGDSRSKDIVEVPGQEKTVYEFEYGRLVKETNGFPVDSPRPTEYTYSIENPDEIASVTDPRGNVTSYEYDASGNVTKMTNPEGGVTTYIYDSLSDLIATRDPDGHAATWEYDSHGNLEAHVVDFGGNRFATTDYTRNAAGEPTKLVDPDGHQVKYTYDSYGLLASVTDGLGDKTTETHNSRGDLLTLTKPRGNVAGANAAEFTTTYEYDAEGNLDKMTDGLGHSTIYGYDADGNRTSEKNAEGATRKWEFDAAGDLISETDPEGHASSYKYNGTGKVISATDPDGTLETFTYKSNNRIRVSFSGRNGTTHYNGYDGNGNVTSVTDPSGTVSTFTYNAMNQMLEEQRNGVTVRANTYDPDGNLLTATNAAGAQTVYTYSSEGQLLSEKDPGGAITRFSYDLSGNLKSVTDPAGRLTTYTYDAAQRLTKVSYNSAATHAVTFSYNQNGDRIGMTDATGNTTFEYDPVDRLTAETNGAGQSIGFGYNGVGEVTSIAYPNGKSIARTYTPAGRISSVTDWLGNTSKFAYDAAGNETATEFPAATGETDSFTYTAGQAFETMTDKVGPATFASESYGYNATSKRLSSEADHVQGAPEVAKNYGYDELERLATVTGGNYAYDNAGDPTTEAGVAGYQYNSQGRLTAAPANPTMGTPAGSFGYDALGERSEFAPTAGSPTQYSWDEAGNLTEVASSSTSAPVSEKDRYNGDGLLQFQSSVSGSNAVNLTWDTQETIPVLLAEGSTSIIYGPGQLPIEQIDGSGNVLYYHHDQQGSTRLLTNSAGAVVSTTEYGPYGNVTASTGTQPVLGYDGQFTDRRGSGLIYLRARWYDPKTGQFMSTDPMRRVTSEPYGYAAGNPLAFADPSGMSLLGDIGGAIGSAATWAYEHPGQVVEGVAAGVCVVASDGVCLGAVGGALGVVTYENGNEYFSGEISLGEALEHEGLSVGETALFGGAGLVKAGLGATGALEGTLPKSFLGNAALNGLVTWPSAVGIALEKKIELQVFC